MIFFNSLKKTICGIIPLKAINTAFHCIANYTYNGVLNWMVGFKFWLKYKQTGKEKFSPFLSSFKKFGLLTDLYQVDLKHVGCAFSLAGHAD